jgi:beta-lactamase superfamily II metal-dependent hydrolase
MALTSSQPTAASAMAGRVAPPAGVHAGAYLDLLSSRSQLNRQTVLEIDDAANNTSIVLEIEWRAWRLLFGGDAEDAAGSP